MINALENIDTCKLQLLVLALVVWLSSHRATIYCEQRQIDLRATMKTLADLSDKLIQIHAAYVINRDKICHLDRRNHTVILDTCVALPYSKRGALDFVDKSLCETKFKQRIRSAIRVANRHLALQTQQTPEIVTLPSSHQREIVDVNDMIYIASNVMADQPALLLAALQADRQPKVILIDLALHHVVHAGLNVAQAIRSFDSLSPIIIVSTHTELLAMSYQYQICGTWFIFCPSIFGPTT
ncbi:hypothetical protein GQS40_13215|uniref:HTH LytTR-type domain-containing protein n=1 Tax=Leuconostoc lactis TaxID=1246 RepID=A0A6L7AE43_LEULA|nr:hypothetical protein [Leuconostoc lactis]